MTSFKLNTLMAREVLDSRGNPTVECEVIISVGADKFSAQAISPSGASTGAFEALEMRDKDPERYLGKGVLKAVGYLNEELAGELVGQSFDDFWTFEQAVLQFEGTENKSRLGANTLLALSLSVSTALAKACGLTYAEWIRDRFKDQDCEIQMTCPIPLMNIINGGAHANNGLDIQEFMVVPHGFDRFSEALRAGVEIFHHLKVEISSRGLSTSVGDEGGFAPVLKSNKDALDLISLSVEKAGYRMGDQISLALDVAATEFFKEDRYHFHDPSLGVVDGGGLVNYFEKLCADYPIISIEDGASEDDWDTWKAMTEVLGDNIQLVGDDLFVTQETRLKKGVDESIANSILIKFNQVGTLSETIKTMIRAKKANFHQVVSHRSGETEDVSLTHLVVGSGAGQVKTGSASRTDRVAKYNELLRLEQKLALPIAKWPS